VPIKTHTHSPNNSTIFRPLAIFSPLAKISISIPISLSLSYREHLLTEQANPPGTFSNSICSHNSHPVSISLPKTKTKLFKNRKEPSRPTSLLQKKEKRAGEALEFQTTASHDGHCLDSIHKNTHIHQEHTKSTRFP